MHYAVLILAWITPALVAGAVGWSGIWGTGSALGEYLIPIPVAGGVFHVPSFLVTAAIILSSRSGTGRMGAYLPVLGFAALVAALSLMLEFDRLNAWLFTDYVPHGSPLRLDGNPLLLFIATDAFWVGAYGLMRGFKPPARSWLVLPLIPAAVIGLNALNYQVSGPVFERGGMMYTGSRGEKVMTVYTSEPYDEAVFLEWLNEDPYFARPWYDANSEHTAVVFTNSMQMIEWGQYERIESESTVATLCLYEEDRSIVPHSGFFDCFAERNTVEQNLAELVADNSTGLGRDIDFWYSRALLCDGVEVSESADSLEIAQIDVCRGLIRSHQRTLDRFIQKYGEDSDQVKFVTDEASARGLAEN